MPVTVYARTVPRSVIEVLENMFHEVIKWHFVCLIRFGERKTLLSYFHLCKLKHFSGCDFFMIITMLEQGQRLHGSADEHFFRFILLI